MRLIKTIADLKLELKSHWKSKTLIGFVPTMGALHEGHLGLVKKALEENEVVVASIYVNPTQFNNAEDLKNYPRTLAEDLEKLKKTGCSMAFVPSNEEIYDKSFKFKHVELNSLDEVMEGKSRPGHFMGVVNVVQRLLDLVKPNNAYFGKKDFQQLAVINAMRNQLNLKVNIVACETQRDHNGLALSSRNLLIDPTLKKDAYAIYNVFQLGLNLVNTYTPREAAQKMKDKLNQSRLSLEYLEIVDPNKLKPIDKWVPGATVCVAAYCGKVRLIDNFELIAQK